MKRIFEYDALLHRVIDGDTYVLNVDLGFNVWCRVTVRLRDLDCPEVNTPEGLRALQAATFELAKGNVSIQSYKGQQSFARWVADVWVDGVLLADTLRAQGHVKGAVVV
jgi:endonuclease YncB( thermonuclease family)